MSGYHEDTTGSLVRMFSNLEHIDTHLGRAIREFHSAIGISLEFIGWGVIGDEVIM
jgi:hypothetical protein